MSIHEAYERLCSQLKVIDLSSNSLSRLPKFFYELTALKEIYFDENELKKIPNEMFQRARTNPDDEANFQRLKHLQALQERERIKRERREKDPDYMDEEV